MLMPVLAMAALGVALGVALAYAARRFHVPVDAKVEGIAGALPGANCGGCGFAGCAAFAEAVARGAASPLLCAPGGAATAAKVGEIMGIEATVSENERPLAMVGCRRKNVAVLSEYAGVATCRGADLPGLSGGPTACRYGCLGFGDCVAACPFGALSRGGEGEPIVVDEEKCVGCRRCEKACPRRLIAVAPQKRAVLVACHNRDKGPQAHRICQHACIACKKCERTCPFDAIHAPNYLAEIDYAKCRHCGKCAAVCPQGTIVDQRQARKLKARAAAVQAQAAAEASPVS